MQLYNSDIKPINQLNHLRLYFASKQHPEHHKIQVILRENTKLTLNIQRLDERKKNLEEELEKLKTKLREDEEERARQEQIRKEEEERLKFDPY